LLFVRIFVTILPLYINHHLYNHISG